VANSDSADKTKHTCSVWYVMQCLVCTEGAEKRMY